MSSDDSFKPITVSMAKSFNLSRYEYGDPRMKPRENEIFKRQRKRDRDKRQKFVFLREELRKVKQ